MALIKRPLTTIVLLACLTCTLTVARDTLTANPSFQSLAARLEGEDGGGMMECWSTLLELKSCTNEIIIFFINGEGYLGLECCKAIRTITQHCWPSLLTSLGYTAEECDILRDYCGGSPSPPPAATTIDHYGIQG